MSNRTKKTLEEKIAVMQHYLDGGKVISSSSREVFRRDKSGDLSWNWYDQDYSIYEEPKTKPSINWSHVSKDYKYMATDEDGRSYLYKSIPTLRDTIWYASHEEHGYAGVFSSLVPGTCDWKDSLVERPEGI